MKKVYAVPGTRVIYRGHIVSINANMRWCMIGGMIGEIIKPRFPEEIEKGYAAVRFYDFEDYYDEDEDELGLDFHELPIRALELYFPKPKWRV